jgi:putative transposase
VYDKEIDPVEITPSRYIGIDPGVRNVVTIANNFGAKPIIVKGGVAKSMGQFYNKEKERIQSIYAKLKDERGRKLKYGNALRKLDWKRNNKFNDYCHKLSRMIVDYAFENNVSTIVIGKNPLWKQESEMSKRNNQQFVQFHTLESLR